MPLITHNNNPVESIFLKIVTRIDFQLKKDDDEGRDADLVLRACLFKKKHSKYIHDLLWFRKTPCNRELEKILYYSNSRRLAPLLAPR